MGDVISQSPSMGTDVAPGSPVNLVVSSGPTLIMLPDVTGQTQAVATTTLNNLGLVVSSSTQNHPAIPVGDVISQTPEADLELTAGSTVNLIISLGPLVPTVSDIHDIPTISFWGLMGLLALIPMLVARVSMRKSN